MFWILPFAIRSTKELKSDESNNSFLCFHNSIQMTNLLQGPTDAVPDLAWHHANAISTTRAQSFSSNFAV